MSKKNAATGDAADDDVERKPNEHPGWYLRRLITRRNLTQKQVSDALSCSPALVNKILLGQRSVTPKLAVELEGLFTVPADQWLAMQGAYNASQVRKGLDFYS